VPTYAYVCTECDHRFEAQQAFTDDALTACPECSGRLRKLFNAVGIVFKGSGFYRTDSRNTSSRSTSGAGSAPATSSDSSSTSSTSSSATSNGGSSSSTSSSSSSSATSSAA
jgi:putative FmdB family regulatory protein